MLYFCTKTYLSCYTNVVEHGGAAKHDSAFRVQFSDHVHTCASILKPNTSIDTTNLFSRFWLAYTK